MSLTKQSTKSLTHGVEIVFSVAYKMFFLLSLIVNVILCFVFTGIMYYSHSMKKALHPAILRCSFAFIELFLFYFEVVVLSLLKKTAKLFWLGVLLAFCRFILIIFCMAIFLYTHETYTDWLIIYAQGHQAIPGLLIILSVAIFCVEVIVMKKYHTFKEMVDPGRQEVDMRKNSINTSNYDMKMALKEMRRARRRKENQERNPSTGSSEEGKTEPKK